MAGNFADRLALFEEYLAPIGVAVPAADELRAADELVSERLAGLRDVLGAPSAADLTEFGARVAKGELKPETVKSRLSSFPSVSTDHVLIGARDQWRVQADKPEWSEDGLRESCVSLVRELVDADARELFDSWESLPSWIQDEYRHSFEVRGSVDLRDIARDLDVTTISGAELEARRRVSRVFNDWHIGATHEWRNAVEFLAFGSQVENRYEWGKRGVEWESSLIMLDSDAAALRGAGFSLSSMVVSGLVDQFAPLADPLGSDREEYELREAAFNRVRDWRFEFNLKAHSGVPFRRGEKEALKARLNMSPMQVVSQMRQKGVWHE